jgi:hypothetical protein
VDLLTADAVLYGDGGGKARAIRQPLDRGDRVAACILALFKRVVRFGGTVEPVLVNSGAGLIDRDPQGKIVGVVSLEARDEVMRAIASPDKLQHLGSVSAVARLRRRPEEKPGALRESR